MTYKELQKEIEKIIDDSHEWTDNEVRAFIEEAKRQFRKAGYDV